MRSQRDQKPMRGSIVPLITPFKEEGEIDEDTLASLIDWQIRSGSHGISVTGTSGEPSALSLEEREYVIELAGSAVDKRVPFLPGTGTNSTDETIRLTQHAAKRRADAALVIVPYYNRPSQEGLYRHFRAVSAAVDLPIVIYNIPGRTGVNMEPQTMARLRNDCPSVVGVKEANKDFEHVSRVLLECGRDFLVYSGIELLCYPMLAIGGAGHVSATANVLPDQVAELFNLVEAGRYAEATDLHYHLAPLNDVLFIETNPGPVKWALGLLGKANPRLRLPLCEPSPEHQLRIRAVLESYGLLAQQEAVA